MYFYEYMWPALTMLWSSIFPFCCKCFFRFCSSLVMLHTKTFHFESSVGSAFMYCLSVKSIRLLSVLLLVMCSIVYFFVTG